MSYLDVPRLHFTGTFMANPSTINNDPKNYAYQPVTNPINLDLSWNPYGSHAWTINATVRSFVDTNSQLHTSGDPLIGAAWGDVQPILYKYYYLYAYMASIVDISDYAAVVANAQAIQQVFSLPFSDPNYMPVTREMSSDEKNLILNWIKAGCPS
jgi:hypothetical protein